jgi:membrane-associated protein
MSNLIAGILNINPALAGTIVGLLVFAEDALFVGFVIPGETAAVLGGVLASLGHLPLWLILPIVILAAIVGDTVGYEVGKHFGPALLNARILAKRRGRLDRAQDFLRRRGGLAVFLGRFVAFFRAVMPALAGTSRMPYRRFVAFNAAGGIVWGTIYVLLGFFAGKSYEAVARTVGQDTAIVVGAVVVIGIISWQVVSRLRRRHSSADADDPHERRR